MRAGVRVAFRHWQDYFWGMAHRLATPGSSSCGGVSDFLGPLSPGLAVVFRSRSTAGNEEIGFRVSVDGRWIELLVCHKTFHGGTNPECPLRLNLSIWMKSSSCSRMWSEIPEASSWKYFARTSFAQRGCRQSFSRTIIQG